MPASLFSHPADARVFNNTNTTAQITVACWTIVWSVLTHIATSKQTRARLVAVDGGAFAHAGGIDGRARRVVRLPARRRLACRVNCAPGAQVQRTNDTSRVLNPRRIFELFVRRRRAIKWTRRPARDTPNELGILGKFIEMKSAVPSQQKHARHIRRHMSARAACGRVFDRQQRRYPLDVLARDVIEVMLCCFAYRIAKASYTREYKSSAIINSFLSMR